MIVVSVGVVDLDASTTPARLDGSILPASYVAIIRIADPVQVETFVNNK